MNILSRRGFLAQSAAMPFVFGLVDLDAQESRDAEPSWFRTALARMKDTGRWGLGLVIPNGAPRFRWGQGLWTLTAFPDEDVDAHEIFCESVVMAVTPEFVAKRYGLKERCDRFLLAPEGRLIAFGATEMTLISDSKAFAESFRRFIHGTNNEELNARAKAIEAGLSDDLKRAAERLGSEVTEDRADAALTLARKAEFLTPFLAWLEHGEGNERRRRSARNLLSSYFATLRTDAAGSKLPYGCTGPHHWDPCPSCGMGRIPERSRMFLTFLVPGEPSPKKSDD